MQPDFTTASPTPISTRGWVAWYTAAGGWHWLGSRENVGRWDTWTATVDRHRAVPPGRRVSPIPFTLGPISVPAGQAIYAVGVYEIVYWAGGGRTTSGSTSTRARPARAAGGAATTTACIRDCAASSSPAAPASSAPTSSTRCSPAATGVAVLDDLSTGGSRTSPARSSAARRLHTGDITDPHAVASAFAAARPDVVFHLAAQIDVRGAVGDPARDARSTCRHRHAARGGAPARSRALRAGLDRRRDLRRRGRRPDARERAARGRLSPYAASKAAAESYLELYARCTGSRPSACGWRTSTARARTRAARPA